MQTPFHHIHRHIRQHHKKYLLGTAIGGLGFFMIKVLVSLIGIFGVLQYPGTFASGGPACGGRDNSQFLTGSFRESTPDNDKIICALLGDGTGGTNRTAYTSGRNTIACNISNMVVTGVAPGTDTLPVNLAANTIYVLESGTYETTATRNMATCSAILGKGTVEIKGNFTTNARLLSSSSKNNWILDNISLNRNRGTNVGTTVDVMGVAASSSLTINTIKAYSGYVGINIYSASNYANVNNSESYDNSSYGIYFYNSMNYGKINNCRVYNNSNYGIVFNLSAASGQINNSQVYNNSGGGIWIISSLYAKISNSTAYNNTGQGIYFYNNANYGQINNSQSYNNTSIGIYGYNVTNLIINTAQSYNNASYGIDIYNTQATPPPNYSKINNSQIYNNSSYGITMRNVPYTQINNTQSYNNNNYGIFIYKSSNAQINNSQSYNNVAYGIGLQTSNYVSINNSQIYNNSNYGISFTNGTNYGLLNNMQIYDNGASGITIISGSNTIISNSNIYNNVGYGITINAASLGNVYYGINNVFGNTSANVQGSNFITGTDGLMGRSNGILDQTAIVGRDYISNPKNISGEYLFSRTGTMASLRGRKTNFGFDTGMQYSYGSGILTQVAPVVYSGTTLVISGTYNANNYIGGNIAKITGDILGINQYNAVNVVVTGIGNLPISTYTIYGNIQNILGEIPIHTSTTIQLTTGMVTNTLIVQLYDPINYFATHFQKTTTIDQTPPSSPLLLSPIGGVIDTGNIVLLRSGAVDTGVGMGGYRYEISTNNSFATTNFSGSTLTTGIYLTGFTDGLYYRRVAAYDNAGNTGSRSSIESFTITTAVMLTPPIVGTGYIFAGTTGNNNGNIYYVGTVTSRAYLSGIDITSCEYSTGGERSAATIGSDYCEIANQDFGSDIVLSFRATNTGGITTGASTSYIYDATPPSGGSFTINANANYTTGTNVFLTTTCATDTGINGTQVAFGSSASPTNWQSCSASMARTLPSGEGTKTVYMRFKDGLGNITNATTDTIQVDTLGPVAPALLSPISGVVLTTGNIQLLRSGSLDAGIGTSGYVWQVSTGSTFVSLITGGNTSSTGVNLLALSATTYYRRVYAVDQLNNTGARSATGYFSISSAINFDIAAPTTLNIGSISVPENTQVIEKIFTGTATYFTLADYVGDDQGYYTTLSMTNLTDGQGHIVSNANVAIKTATNIVTISGSSNPNVVTSITGSYIHFGNNVLTFIKRDAGTNNGVKGVYGVAPALQVTIPELQTPGNYSGTLIYTFYPN